MPTWPVAWACTAAPWCGGSAVRRPRPKTGSSWWVWTPWCHDLEESCQQRHHGVQTHQLLPVLGRGRLTALPPHHSAAVHAQAAGQVGVVGEGDLGDMVALLDQRLVRSDASRHNATIMLRGLQVKIMTLRAGPGTPPCAT